jgi:hypothetical protein
MIILIDLMFVKPPTGMRVVNEELVYLMWFEIGKINNIFSA